MCQARHTNMWQVRLVHNPGKVARNSRPVAAHALSLPAASASSDVFIVWVTACLKLAGVQGLQAPDIIDAPQCHTLCCWIFVAVETVHYFEVVSQDCFKAGTEAAKGLILNNTSCMGCTKVKLWCYPPPSIKAAVGAVTSTADSLLLTTQCIKSYLSCDKAGNASAACMAKAAAGLTATAGSL